MALISLEEAKTYLRVDADDEDALIGGLLSSAEKLCADVARLSEEQWSAVNGTDDSEQLVSLRAVLRVAILYTLGYLYEHREQADHQAQSYAKQQKADKVVKTSVTKQMPDIQNPDGSKTPGQQIVENDYYAINLNRKHDVKLGVAVIDSTAYIEASYRNREVECQIFYSPKKQAAGAGIKYTVAKW